MLRPEELWRPCSSLILFCYIIEHAAGGVGACCGHAQEWQELDKAEHFISIISIAHSMSARHTGSQLLSPATDLELTTAKG